MSDVSTLEEEIKEMESKIFGTEEVVDDPEKQDLETADSAEATTEDSTLADEDSSTENVPAVEDEEKPKKKRTNWRKRYTDLQSYSDSTKYEMEQEVSTLKEQLMYVNQELAAMRVKNAPPKPTISELLSQDDKDMLGADTVDSLSSATEKVIDQSVNPLREELEKEREKTRKLEEASLTAQRKKEYAKFKTELDSLAPNAKKLNEDSAFVKWLQMKDTYSSHSRFNLLRQAEKARDAFAVSRFFNEYTEANKPKEDILREQVAPNSSSTPATPQDSKEKVWTHAEMDSVYTNIREGKYTPEQGQKLMSDIEDAVLSGRVR